MIWTKVPSEVSNDKVPTNMCTGTFTAISESTAVLFGRFRNRFSSDFWLLNIDSAKKQLQAWLPDGYSKIF